MTSRGRNKSETFVRGIVFAVDSVVITRSGMALLDTGCRPNFVSLDFAALFFRELKNCDHARPLTPAFESVNGTAINHIMEFRARWYCKRDGDIEGPLFEFDPKLQPSTFYVVDGLRFDVIIGRDDIEKHNLVGRGRSLLATGFRSNHPSQGWSSREIPTNRVC
jgi:hypothetical protein